MLIITPEELRQQLEDITKIVGNRKMHYFIKPPILRLNAITFYFPSMVNSLHIIGITESRCNLNIHLLDGAIIVSYTLKTAYDGLLICRSRDQYSSYIKISDIDPDKVNNLFSNGILGSSWMSTVPLKYRDKIKDLVEAHQWELFEQLAKSITYPQKK